LYRAEGDKGKKSLAFRVQGSAFWGKTKNQEHGTKNNELIADSLQLKANLAG